MSNMTVEYEQSEQQQLPLNVCVSVNVWRNESQKGSSLLKKGT